MIICRGVVNDSGTASILPYIAIWACCKVCYFIPKFASPLHKDAVNKTDNRVPVICIFGWGQCQKKAHLARLFAYCVLWEKSTLCSTTILF